MADYAPPPGPPPPRVPEGWKAVFNDQYKEWYDQNSPSSPSCPPTLSHPCPALRPTHPLLHRFYVNVHTKQSTWEKPTAPAPRPGSDYFAPSEAPPGYAGGGGGMISADTKKAPLESNNPYSAHPGGYATDSDAALAARLQAEEDARVNAAAGPGSRSPHPAGGGGGDGYYGQRSGAGAAYPGAQEGSPTGGFGASQQLPPRPDEQPSYGSRGLLSKLMGKGKSSHSQQRYGQQGGYGGYGPPQGYGGYPQQGYGGGPQYMQQQPRRSGMGAGGAAALGLGGGLLGGVMLGEAMEGVSS